MTLEILFKYIHFVSIFTIVGVLVGEYVLLKPELTKRELTTLSKLDALYGLASITLLGAGFSLWFWVGKPAELYTNNGFFLAKLGLFTVVGVLSVVPTLYINKHKKGENQEEVVQIPKKIKRFVQLELAIMTLIPLLASLMAKGIGYFGE